MGYPSRWEWVLGRGLVDSVHAIEQPGMHLLFGVGLTPPGQLQTFLGSYDVILSYRPDSDGVFAHNLKVLGARLVLSQPPFPPPPPPKIHVADFALQLVAQLGVPVPPAGAGLSLSEAELALASPFFATHQIDPLRQPIIVVHPGSGSVAKRWPLRCFATLIERVESELGVRTVIVTGYAETEMAARLRSLTSAATPLVAENWPLLPTAALLAQAAVVVGHDSGLTHLAAALQRPTVAIFGPTDPEIWAPRGERVTVVPMLTPAVQRGASSSGREIFQADQDALRQVLEAVQHWLSGESTRRNRGDQWATS
jgi:ADP-heptose:LPS heptosyltransferase